MGFYHEREEHNDGQYYRFKCVLLYIDAFTLGSTSLRRNIHGRDTYTLSGTRLGELWDEGEIRRFSIVHLPHLP